MSTQTTHSRQRTMSCLWASLRLATLAYGLTTELPRQSSSCAESHIQAKGYGFESQLFSLKNDCLGWVVLCHFVFLFAFLSKNLMDDWKSCIQLLCTWLTRCRHFQQRLGPVVGSLYLSPTAAHHSVSACTDKHRYAVTQSTELHQILSHVCITYIPWECR